METQPLLAFKSHIEGKNADVTIYSDRIEWARHGLMGGKKGAEVIPIKSVSSVVVHKDGLTRRKVHVVCTGNTIDFRVSKDEAEAVQQTITQLLLGSHSSQQAPAAPAPMPPGTPAGWQPDPTGAAAQRYWDGNAWTEHTA